MNKAQILVKLERAWNEFNETCAGLSEAEMVEAGVVEDWSIKDILAHVTWWEEEALKHLPHIAQGGRPPRYSVVYGGIDTFNAQMTELKRDLPLAEVRKQLAETHNRLVDYIEDAPDELFTSETRFRRRLRLDTYSHYPIHAQEIQHWRERSG